jgi:hypothetical protein
MLVAVELKLRDWRKACVQASQYLIFADAAVVAMPASRVTSALLEEAERLGLGVVGVTAEGVVEYVQADISAPADPWFRARASEQLFHCFVGGGSGRKAGSKRGRS